MTLPTSPYGIRQYLYQIVLLDMQGCIYESCDSIFSTEQYLEGSLRNLCYFFEGELDSILNSNASKISFDKIKIDCKVLPGCYDFVFSKLELDGQTFILWEIYDYTNIYKQFTFIQQLQHEIAIQRQLTKKNLGSAKNNAEFFQSGYTSSYNTNINKLLTESIDSKFDVFSQLSDNLNDSSVSMRLDDLKNCADSLAHEINNFAKQLKFSEGKQVEIRTLFRSMLLSHAIHFDTSLPQMIGIDENLVNKVLQILGSQYTPQPDSNTKDIEVTLHQNLTSGSTFLGITVKENAKYVVRSACCFVKLSTLKSIVAMVGGDLTLALSENETVFETKINLPIKINV